MNFDSELYSPQCIPVESSKRFVKKILPELGWDKNIEDEVVMDVGCGAGGTTAKLIFPLFTHSKKIFAVDFLPGMIDLAKRENSHPLIEYSVANIGDWSTVKQWEDQITKLVSIHCFEWVKDQKKCFQNVFKLLKKDGQAALCFVLQSSFYDSVLEIEKNAKWRKFFEGIDNYVSESHYKKYDYFYYKQILEDIGFDIVYCREEVKMMYFLLTKNTKIFSHRSAS
ncbi:juvenile hormone acid O-methyltransferase [Caerostris darwini]|uniref:Juvenile hormone acid O-methyltransferase n=1 Tax=Caerostris darwini TaxID=1538125 RepID=A0AAV4SMX2_9ARAC|nr:juvenile hormone acid O-methyltransferase [Caerostris darwini]